MHHTCETRFAQLACLLWIIQYGLIMLLSYEPINVQSGYAASSFAAPGFVSADSVAGITPVVVY